MAHLQVKVATAQVQTIADPGLALQDLETRVRRLNREKVDLVLFPEVYIGGFPRLSTFGNSSIGQIRAKVDYEAFLHHYQASVDLGDTPMGENERWLKRELPTGKHRGHRGDGTREALERISRESDIVLVVGVLERAGTTLFSSLVYICPRRGMVGKRRKMMPTGLERVIWGQGSAETLRAVTVRIKGVDFRICGALCWENWMPLLRQSIYAQNIDIFFAPTAHATEIWTSLMRTIAVEGNVFVLSATPCVNARQLPAWITEAADFGDEVVSRGGSIIVGPPGDVLCGPCWEKDDEILMAELSVTSTSIAARRESIAGYSTQLDDFKLVSPF